MAQLAKHNELDARTSRVFVIDGLPQDATSLRLFELPHPKHEHKAFYGLTEKRLFEIQKVHEKPSSWFIGDSVKKDGGLYVCTPVDPTFIALQSILLNSKQSKENDGLFNEKSHLLENSEYPMLSNLAKMDNLQLELICDTKESTGDVYYRYSKSKVLSWLQTKVERIRQHLISKSRKSRLTESKDTLSEENPTEDTTSSDEPPKDKFNLNPALGIISEYVSTSLFEDLVEEYGLILNDVYGKKRKSLSSGGIESVNADKEYDMDFQSRRKKKNVDADKIAKAKKKAEENNRKRKLNAKGMKSISSFFGPKKKKAKKAKK